ncbi:hypothetical protein BOX15_Mlig034090g4 [Macrostomum lignano]|uniref:Enkurin domain-containing protein n=1 Tax=Macrostomum lignano TaxID=282301 RepID=A0A267H2Y4_9PLAT|nr:hypothetical protein BOX15_Mlig034090g4 [Macrostomum lignano]
MSSAAVAASPAAHRQQRRAPKREYLRAHEKTGPDLEADDHPVPPFRRTAPLDRVSVPRASSANDLRLIRRSVNYVRANANAAAAAGSRRPLGRSGTATAMSKSANDLSGYRRGELPAYLVRRRREFEAAHAAEVAARPDPDQPPGHRRLSDLERRKTLALLTENHQLLLAELNRLPVRSDTVRLVCIKSDIERKLAELEEAIKIFSRPKVFVKVDA